MADPAPAPTTTALESRARSLLASSIRTVGSGSNDRYVYPAPCDSGPDGGVEGAGGVVDSTTTLLAARTFAKLGRSDLAWDFLRTLFAAQGSNGFLPRYAYLNRTDGETGAFEGAGWDHFSGPYPGPRLFDGEPGGRVPKSSPASNARGGGKKSRHSRHTVEPDHKEDYDKVKIWSSNTIMAPPYHATSILETFYLSNQTIGDVDNLENFYHRLQSWHQFLHSRVVHNCTMVPGEHGKARATPCLMVGHPWETDVDMSSPLWQSALGNVTKIVAYDDWRPDFEVPAAVKDSFDYPGDEAYDFLLYLQHCLSKHAEEEDDEGAKKVDGPPHHKFRSACPFQMADVGFLSALSRADRDMIQISKILTDKNAISQPSRDAAESAENRAKLSERMLHGLWDDAGGTYFDRAASLAYSDPLGSYVSNETVPMELPLGHNFLALWDRLGNETRVESVASHLLRRTGKFSFYCGDYPLWSSGGCEATTSSPIEFLLNHRVAKGLKRNGEAGLGHFVESSTLNLFCGLPNSGESDVADCHETQQFARALDAATNVPLGRDQCGLTSTLTAAVVLDVLIPDGKFSYQPEPPISSSSVIFLIAVEMVVAFGVGVACLVLSLNLVRRARADDEGDAFVNAARERAEEEELLVRSPVEDGEEAEGFEGGTEHYGVGQWAMEMITHLPMRLWGGHDE